MRLNDAKMNWAELGKLQAAATLIPPSLRPLAEGIALDAGELLFHTDQPVKQAYLILAGELSLVRHCQRGNELVLQRVSGGFFAEASLFSKRYHCDAVARTNATLLSFPLSDFRTALDGEAEFRNAWMAHLSGTIRKLRSQNERLGMNSAAERILHYIEVEGADGILTLQQSRKAWAGELGLSHEALYRTLRKLEVEGVLTLADNRIELRR